MTFAVIPRRSVTSWSTSYYYSFNLLMNLLSTPDFHLDGYLISSFNLSTIHDHLAEQNSGLIASYGLSAAHL